MRRAALAVAASLLALTGLSATAQERSVRVVNRTGEPAVGLSVDGGRNLIAGRTLAAGESVTVPLPPGCRADLRLVLASGAVLDWRGVDLCAAPEVFFTPAAPGRPAERSVGGRASGAGAPAASEAALLAAVQRSLAALGYDPGPVDGLSGPRTRQALAAFQRDRGLAPSGTLDGATLAALGLADGRGGALGAQGPPRPRADGDRLPPAPGASAPQRRAATATGFIVAEGRVLTNEHVTEGCSRIVGVLPGGRRVELAIAARDASRDLALLSGPPDLGPALAFRSTPPRRGDEVVTYGFPLVGILGTSPSLTTGEVSALSGLRGDPNMLITSAPVQSGNSGGPLLDRGGHVVGVVVAKLAALRVAERTGGDLPQNVNFAIQGPVAVEFLRRHGVVPRLAVSTQSLPPA
ncbi:MAG: serine protease, partial [Elioraea sp.]|nr:serine protease [Elioraea sp.]